MFEKIVNIWNWKITFDLTLRTWILLAWPEQKLVVVSKDNVACFPAVVWNFDALIVRSKLVCDADFYIWRKDYAVCKQRVVKSDVFSNPDQRKSFDCRIKNSCPDMTRDPSREWGSPTMRPCNTHLILHRLVCLSRFDWDLYRIKESSCNLHTVNGRGLHCTITSCTLLTAGA